MDIDDDEPPSLVEIKASHTENAPDPTTVQLQDMSLTKVPLTIVTGIFPSKTFHLPSICPDPHYRLPGSRQDNTSKLHPKGAARQANSSNPKRLVHPPPSSPKPLTPPLSNPSQS